MCTLLVLCVSSFADQHSSLLPLGAALENTPCRLKPFWCDFCTPCTPSLRSWLPELLRTERPCARRCSHPHRGSLCCRTTSVAEFAPGSIGIAQSPASVMHGEVLDNAVSDGPSLPQHHLRPLALRSCRRFLFRFRLPWSSALMSS